ncbi:hypothetical protein ACHWQZ_G016889 [Mnemiopsis leidyi]
MLKPVTNVDLLGCYVEAGAGDENETPSFVETWNKWRSPCPKSSYRCIETESSKSATLRLPLYTHVLRTVDCARQYWTAKIKDKRRCTTISSLPTASATTKMQCWRFKIRCIALFYLYVIEYNL